MKHVDDAELWFDPVDGVIQVRPALRLGSGDSGVNRKRIGSFARNQALPELSAMGQCKMTLKLFVMIRLLPFPR